MVGQFSIRNRNLPQKSFHDRSLTAIRFRFDFGLKVCGVAVLVDDDLGAAQPCAVDDAGMVELVGEDHVLHADGSVPSNQRGNGGLVGAEAALYQQRRLDALELCHSTLAIDVQLLRAGDRAYRARSHAPGINRLLRGLFERGEVKAFYYIFSETIRRYMESIRRFPAVEMTTEEIARAIRANPSDQCILPLLKRADLVKFADSMPAPERKDQDVLAARTYIQQTRPKTEELQKAPSLQEVSP